MRIPIFHGNVVVSNLPEGFTAVQLAALFDDFGLVLGAEIDRNRAGRGSIILAPEPAVAKAIEALHGRVLSVRPLKVMRAPPAPKRTKPAVRPPQQTESAPDRIVEAVRKFRAPSEQPEFTAPAPVPAVPARQVVVEYRKTRRFEIPPRAPIAARG
jgi:RNA recognition motif-containing protein